MALVQFLVQKVAFNCHYLTVICRKYLFVLLCVIGAIGCSGVVDSTNFESDFVDDVQLTSPQNNRQYYLDPSLPDSVQYAALLWNTQLGIDIFSNTCTTCPAITIYEVDPTGFAAATGHGEDGSCFIEYTHSVLDFVPTWEHELGHCLGLSHSSYTHSIMYPTVHNDAIITEQIVQALITAQQLE